MKKLKESPGLHSPGGRSFYTRGPAAENFYDQVYYMFAAQAASTCHLNWTTVGDDQRLTEDDTRQPGTREQL